jgi:hypothetical protein
VTRAGVGSTVIPCLSLDERGLVWFEHTTKVVLVSTLAKTEVFGVSPVKASDSVQWEEFGICPGTVP